MRSETSSIATAHHRSSVAPVSGIFARRPAYIFTASPKFFSFTQICAHLNPDST